MSRIVCKFGGTSLADASQMRKVKAIVDADPRRRIIVPSAPGKRSRDDPKSPIYSTSATTWPRCTPT
jgi:aspartate kinase